MVDGFAFLVDIVDVQREHKSWPGKTVSVQFCFQIAYPIWFVWNLKIAKDDYDADYYYCSGHCPHFNLFYKINFCPGTTDVN